MNDDIFAGLDQDPNTSPSVISPRRRQRRNRLHVVANNDAPPSEQQFEATPAHIKDADDALAFMRAGRAVFTVRSKKTGTRFTFKVTTSDDGRMRFVGVLTGTDDLYQYIGHIFIGREVFMHGRKSKIAFDAPSVKAFGWVWCQLNRGTYPNQLELWHEGQCGKCGRALTVPESIERGLGPKCAGLRS